jgi:excisionase family DNA binding protein
MDVREAAAFLRIEPTTLYGLVSQRRIPFRKAGRRLLFLESELLEWTRPAKDRRDGYRDFERHQ